MSSQGIVEQRDIEHLHPWFQGLPHTTGALTTPLSAATIHVFSPQDHADALSRGSN